jgi:hypothetical protein
MIRRYNYTGRKKLFEIRINEWTKKGAKYFEVVCDLRNSGFPDDAKIFVEPYFKSSFLRFDFGTIARFQPPANPEISDLPTTDQLKYRIKIVDENSKHGLILGTADIRGVSIDNPHSGKQSILPVDFVELGNRIWTLEFRADRPVLAVNSLLTDIREKVKHGDFFTLVYPEVIKLIALKLETEDGFYDEGLSGWQAEWMRYFNEVLRHTQLPFQGDEKSVEDWANDISDAFARKYQVIDHYKTSNKTN